MAAMQIRGDKQKASAGARGQNGCDNVHRACCDY